MSPSIYVEVECSLAFYLSFMYAIDLKFQVVVRASKDVPVIIRE